MIARLRERESRSRTSDHEESAAPAEEDDDRHDADPAIGRSGRLRGVARRLGDGSRSSTLAGRGRPTAGPLVLHACLAAQVRLSGRVEGAPETVRSCGDRRQKRKREQDVGDPPGPTRAAARTARLDRQQDDERRTQAECAHRQNVVGVSGRRPAAARKRVGATRDGHGDQEPHQHGDAADQTPGSCHSTSVAAASADNRPSVQREGGGAGRYVP